MARHEPNIRAAAGNEVKGDDLSAILREPDERIDAERQRAIACYLSGDEGWDEAVRLLRGAFATGGTALRDR